MQSGAELSGYRLLTISIRTGSAEVFSVDPATGDARNLTRSPASTERYPSWSPDGSQISFNSDRDGTFNLYRMNADGADLQKLTHETAPAVTGMQSWTQDGAWIYFGLFGKGPPQMCRIAPDGTGFQLIGDGIDPAVSPDGSAIVFARDVPGGHCLFAMDADGGRCRQITTQPNQWHGMHPIWSPDGSRILYSDQVGDSLELFACDPDGGAPTPLTRFGDGAAATSAAVSPDQRWISFRLTDEIYWRDAASSHRTYSERRADKRPVWIMAFNGSNPRVVEPLRYQMTIDGSRAVWSPGCPTL